MALLSALFVVWAMGSLFIYIYFSYVRERYKGKTGEL